MLRHERAEPVRSCELVPDHVDRNRHDVGADAAKAPQALEGSDARFSRNLFRAVETDAISENYSTCIFKYPGKETPPKASGVMPTESSGVLLVM